MSGTNGSNARRTAGATPADGPPDDRPPRPVVRYRDGWRDRIPAELKALRQWVVWSYEWRDGKPADPARRRLATVGKWTKVPYQPEAPVSRARNDAPKTWSSFDRACKAFAREPEIFGGVGFVFHATLDPYCGFDLDACLGDGLGDGPGGGPGGGPGDGPGDGPGVDRVVLPWAADLLGLFDGAYREVSPSGTGIKGIVRASLGDRKGTNARGLGDDGRGAVEIYDRGRFFAITGDVWIGDGSGTIPLAIPENQGAADALFGHVEAVRARKDAERQASKARAGGKRGGGSANGGANGHAHLLLGRAPADDEQLLFLARSNPTNGAAFSALYDHGDLTGHPSDSEADAALCCHLAFWAQKDAGRMERLWLASALGRRGKVVDRPDYRAVTIATAIEKTPNVYRPMPRPPMPVEANQAARTIEASDQFPWTDRGLAERLARQYGHLFRWCQPWRKWLVWDGCRWATDDTLAVDRYLKATIRALPAEAATIPDPEAREAFLKWAMACESKKAHDAALRLVMGEPGIPVVPAQLDANPWLLNCPNGTVDLRVGSLRPHDRSDLITKLCPVEFDPEATAPLWDEVLCRFLPDPDLRRWIDRLFGYALTGTIREHLLAIFYGLGANGKTTILNALYGVMGSDYAFKAPRNLLMEKRGSTHPTEQASLFGKRLVIASETGEGEKFDEALVKELTGDEPITARRMREDPWSFLPSHKLILSTNHKPTVKGSDNGIWRRLKLVEFGVSLSDREQDTTIGDRLREERAGILARAVRGCLAWQAEGLQDAQAIFDATKEYRDEEDTFGIFISERCEKGPKCGPTQAYELYANYKLWAESYGIHPTSITRFGKALKSRGFAREKSSVLMYRGIQLSRSGLGEFAMKSEDDTGDDSDDGKGQDRDPF